MGGIIDEAIRAGVESPELTKQYRPLVSQFKQQGELMDANIQYHPKDIAACITLIKQCSTQTYLALDSSKTGGHKFIEKKAKLIEMKHIEGVGSLQKEREFFRKIVKAYDLISIDTREMKMTPEELWKWVEGGKEEKKAFGGGAPMNYGIKKIAPKGLVLINCRKEDDKALFYKLRMRYNKAFQSKFCGLIKL